MRQINQIILAVDLIHIDRIGIRPTNRPRTVREPVAAILKAPVIAAFDAKRVLASKRRAKAIFRYPSVFRFRIVLALSLFLFGFRLLATIIHSSLLLRFFLVLLLLRRALLLFLFFFLLLLFFLLRAFGLLMVLRLGFLAFFLLRPVFFLFLLGISGCRQEQR